MKKLLLIFFVSANAFAMHTIKKTMRLEDLCVYKLIVLMQENEILKRRGKKGKTFVLKDVEKTKRIACILLGLMCRKSENVNDYVQNMEKIHDLTGILPSSGQIDLLKNLK